MEEYGVESERLVRGDGYQLKILESKEHWLILTRSDFKIQSETRLTFIYVCARGQISYQMRVCDRLFVIMAMIMIVAMKMMTL